MGYPISEAQQRLQALLGLDSKAAERAVSEVLDACSLEVDDFIAARHHELAAQGNSNEEIYRRIASELVVLRFKAPALSERQIRRRIYG